jgi:hypothetical protein
MPAKAREIDRMLRSKLQAVVREGGKHTRYMIEHQGQVVALMVMSHGASEIGEPLLARMAREVGVSRRQFQLLLDCPMSYEEYIDHVGKSDWTPES